jgi:hypothetical protein
MTFSSLSLLRDDIFLATLLQDDIFLATLVRDDNL